MKNFKSLTLGTSFVLAMMMSACAHHRDVRPGADGVNRVIVRAPEKEDADRSAISQAEHYCEQSQKHPAFLEEKNQYTGSMDENTRNTVRKASTAAMVLGTATGTPGRRNSGGGVLGTAGTVGAIMTGGDDYTTEMRFKCQ